MRQTLLNASVEVPEERRRRFPRLRGGAQVELLAGAACGFCVVMIIFISFVKAVDPLQYGLLKSSFSGQISQTPYQGGVHFVLPWKVFVTFPATRVTLEWSANYGADSQPVLTRTGADPNDPDSGGQPIKISCAIQYELIKEDLHAIYLSLGSYFAAHQRFQLLAGNMVSNTAQDFIPQDFWERRPTIAARMLKKIDGVLKPQGARAVAFEIMKIDFAPKFEDSITNIQVATQMSTVNEYAKQVAEVEQQIHVLFSRNDAKIALINAEAVKTSTEIMGNATKNAFIMKQKAKAKGYAELQNVLGFTPPQMAEYIKIQSLVKQSKTGKVVVNVPPPSVASGGTKISAEL